MGRAAGTALIGDPSAVAKSVLKPQQGLSNYWEILSNVASTN